MHFGYHEDEWVAWGCEGDWSQGWGDDGWSDKAWAWDSTAYWDGMSSKKRLEQLEENQATAASAKAPKTNKGNRKRKNPEAEAKDKGEKGEPAKGKKVKKSDATKADKKKRRKDADGRKEVKHKKAKAAPTPAEPDANQQVQYSTVLPDTKEGRVRKVLSYMRKFIDMEDNDETYQLMKEKLASISASRMNVYWKRYSVGLTCKAEKKDFAYFKPTSSNDKWCPPLMCMAAALKGAEMLATRLERHIFVQ